MVIKPIINLTTKYTGDIVGFGVRKLPKPTSLEGLKLAPSLRCDTVQLSNNSYLSDTFVKSLTQIKGKDASDTTCQITYSILKKMGYKHPEALKIEIDPLEYLYLEKLGIGAGFSTTGLLTFSERMINSPVEQLIPMIYHELDHMDKYVKLYKSVGEKRFQELLIMQAKNSPISKSLVQRGIPINVDINKDFYRKMSEHTCIQDFDAKKWSKAVQEYCISTPRYCDQYKYFNNPLEDSAYNIQSKINKILGLSVETPRDEFPKNYTSMIESLKKQGITEPERQEMILQEAIGSAGFKYIDSRIVDLMRKKYQGGKVNDEEVKFIQQSILNFNETCRFDSHKAIDFMQKCSRDAEAYINKGLFTFEDIICSMG